jgi:ABC-type branched-subunit amino acid transport system ATPase component
MEVGSTYVFKLPGDGGGTWTVNLKAPKPGISRGAQAGADCVIETTAADFTQMMQNPAMGMTLFMQGRLMVSGDPLLAMKLQKLFALVSEDQSPAGTSVKPPSPSASEPGNPIRLPPVRRGPLASMELSSFRSFRSLSLNGLTRVNLLVGPNNCGKTSVLEAAEILLSAGNPRVLWRALARRNEKLLAAIEATQSSVRPVRELDVSHLFYGHRLSQGSRLSVRGKNGNALSVAYEIVPAYAADSDYQTELPIPSTVDAGQLLALAIYDDTERGDARAVVPLSSAGGLSLEPIRRLWSNKWRDVIQPINFIGTDGIEAYELSRAWDEIVLTPEEGQVLQALQIIEPEIERLAFVADAGSSSSIFVKLKGSDARLPLGSMGDGVKRLLALAITLVRSAGGYLLFDEIDSGLHYSVMPEMWRLVVQTAQRLNIQVFATTHSQDCVYALAWLYEQSPKLAKDISLHRIDRGETTTVAYSASEVASAARHHLEVRG